MCGKKHKPCIHCGEDRKFRFNKNCPVCKICASKQARKRYAERRQRHLEWRKKWEQEKNNDKEQ